MPWPFGKGAPVAVLLMTLVYVGSAVRPAWGQAPASGAAGGENAASSSGDSLGSQFGSGGPTTADTSVGYIDSAVPLSLLRLRFDAADRDRRPDRADFFWPGGTTSTLGPPLPERQVNWQEFTTYLEYAAQPWFSVFLEAPVRFVEPDFNSDQYGLGDINAGFKWAFLQVPDQTATFQLRAYAPTGAASQGLGNHHATLEPAFLFNRRLNEYLTLEGEVRYWAPLGGTDFAGDVLRYGLGLSYGTHGDEFWLTPVVEAVGWTVLGGKEQVALTPDVFFIQDATGDTIVNIKAGFRAGYGSQWDWYVGYGRALTGTTWYKEDFRAEFRWLF